MQPQTLASSLDFAGPFIRGVTDGVVALLPALLVVAGIMVAFWLVTRRRQRGRTPRRQP